MVYTCDKCKKQFKSEKWFDKHVAKNTCVSASVEADVPEDNSPEQYKCFHCPAVFSSEFEQFEHLSIHEESSKDIFDILQQYGIREPDKTSTHPNVSNVKKIYKCAKCLREFPTEFLRKCHVKALCGIVPKPIHPETNNTVSCDLCGEIYGTTIKDESALSNHLKGCTFISKPNPILRLYKLVSNFKGRIEMGRLRAQKIRSHYEISRYEMHRNMELILNISDCSFDMDMADIHPSELNK